MSETHTEAEVVAAVAYAAAEPHALDTHGPYSVVLPAGATHHLIDLHDRNEARSERPERRKGTVTALDAASFARLVTDLGPQHGRTAIYGDVQDLCVTAVLNDDEAGADPLADIAAWRDHRIVLPVVRTKQWERWLGRDGKIGDQVEFAHHLEANLADIAEPPGADLLELAQTFEAATAAEFKSGARLQDGSRQLVYVETIDARAGQQGQITIPDTFTLVVAPFEGAEPVQVTARLRYRVRNGALAIGYELHQPGDVERAAFDSVLATIGAGTKIDPYHAKAPAAR